MNSVAKRCRRRSLHALVVVSAASLPGGVLASDFTLPSSKTLALGLRGGSQTPKIPPSLQIQKSSHGDTSTDVVEIEAQQFDESLYEENFVDVAIPAQFIADTKLPNEIGQFRLRAYRIERGTNEFTGTEPCVIYSAENPPFGQHDVPVRVHDQCVTSEVFGSQRCDCKEQLDLALEFVMANGGAVIYLQQEGRGIGLANKVAAYALQDKGLDTVDANLHLGLPEDCRQYGVVPSILQDMNIGSIALMTNNPRKVDRLSALGVTITSTIPVVVSEATPYNRRYLEAKVNRMDHENLADLVTGRGRMPPKTNRMNNP